MIHSSEAERGSMFEKKFPPGSNPNFATRGTQAESVQQPVTLARCQFASKEAADI